MKRITLAGLAVLILATTTHFTAQAKNLTLHNLLVPIDCVFESVNDGLGTINYLTPAECNQIVPPIDPVIDNSPPETITPVVPTVIAPTVPVYVRTSEGKQDSEPVYDIPGESRVALLLNSISAASQASGYRVKIKAGDTLFYRPLDNPRATVRSITFATIDDDSVWWDLRPFGLNFKTAYGETEYFDSLKSGEKAASLQVSSINSNATADIIVRLYQPKTVSSASKPPLTTIIVLVVLLVGCVAILRFKPEWLGDFKR